MKVHSAQSNNLTPHAKSSHTFKKLVHAAVGTGALWTYVNQPPTKPISINLPQSALSSVSAQTHTINLPTPVLRPNP